MNDADIALLKTEIAADTSDQHVPLWSPTLDDMSTFSVLPPVDDDFQLSTSPTEVDSPPMVPMDTVQHLLMKVAALEERVHELTKFVYINICIQ
jgi:hypothetical protein